MSRPSGHSGERASHACGSQSLHAILARERDEDASRAVSPGVKDVTGASHVFSPPRAIKNAGALWREALSLARGTPESPADLAFYCKTIIECGSLVTQAQAASVELLEEIYSVGGITNTAATALSRWIVR